MSTKKKSTKSNKTIEKQYYRDPKNGVIAGVLAGFADYTGWDIFVLRVLVVVIALGTAIFPFVIAYLIIWLISPVKPSGTSSKTSKSSKSVSAKSTHSESSVSNNGRIILIALGFLGILILLPITIALIPSTVFGLTALFTTDIPEKPLLISAAITGIVFAITLLSIGYAICGSLFTGRFKRSTGISLIINIVFAMMLLTATCIVGAIWCVRVGHDGINQTVDSLTDGNYSIEINSEGHHVKIHRNKD
ncbi:PspC domain-containing protein [Candidatus Saccharibacteria bacterium]|nr:PspC domain-containing protein [Candidatus Saccharibacteria bacterium]